MIFWASDGSDTCKSFKITGGSASGSCCTSDETPPVLGIASGVSHWQTFAIFDCGLCDVTVDPTFRLTAAFKACKKYFLFKKLNKKGNKIYQGREHLLIEICNHSSVSLSSTDWLLFLRCNNGCTNPREAVIPNSSRLSHGVSSWTSRRWARPSGLKCLEQTTEPAQAAVTSHVSPSWNRTIAFSVILFLRFRTIIAIKRYGMKCNTFLYVSFVATSPYNTPSCHFYELHSQPFPQKQVNVQITESPCSRFYVTSGLGPCPVDRDQDGGILTYFDDPWKIEDLTKSKNFWGNLLQKISCVILVKKHFWC